MAEDRPSGNGNPLSEFILHDYNHIALSTLFMDCYPYSPLWFYRSRNEVLCNTSCSPIRIFWFLIDAFPLSVMNQFNQSSGRIVGAMTRGEPPINTSAACAYYDIRDELSPTGVT